MKRFGICMMVGGLAIMALTTAGCLLFLAGAGVGAVAYYDNELCASREVTMDRAWNAANAAMKEMAYTLIPAETHKDATSGIVQGRNAKDQIIRIKLTRQTEKATEIRIRVGTFATSDDRSAESLLFEKICKHF